MKKLLFAVMCTVPMMSIASSDICIDDFYTTTETINGIKYPREYQLEGLVNTDDNTLEELLSGLIGQKQNYIKSSMLRYIELALKGDRYRFYDDLREEIKDLNLESIIKNTKKTLTKKSNIEIEALKILTSALDTSDSALLKSKYLLTKADKSSYIRLDLEGNLKADKYNTKVKFNSVTGSLDADYYNIKQGKAATDIGIIKFIKLDLSEAESLEINTNKNLYSIKKYSESILEVTSKGKILNYICTDSCPIMLKAQIDLDISLPSKISEAVRSLKLNKFKKENKYKNLSNTQILDKLKAQESYKIKQIFSVPTKENVSNLEYKFSEVSLNPNEALYFEVPEIFSTMKVSGITICHRQDERPSTNDTNPGLTAVAIYSKDMPHDKAWRYWGGHASGIQGAKFAEQRRRAEIDTLYEWPRHGHKSVNDNSKSDELIQANTIRVRNVSRDEIKIDSISLKTIFLEKMLFDDYIFTNGSDFGDPVTLKSRYYAGGQVKRGTFPNALRLYKRSSKPYTTNFPANWIYDSERVFIPLDNINLATIEVMAGDTHPDRVRNKDGGWGSLGNARLSVGIADNTDPDYDTQVEWLSDEDNIGPQGVTPISVNKIKKIDGKYLILKNSRRSSPLYIMGIRIGHQKMQKETK